MSAIPRGTQQSRILNDCRGFQPVPSQPVPASFVWLGCSLVAIPSLGFRWYVLAMSSATVGNLEARVKLLERAVSSQAELIVSLGRRIEMLRWEGKEPINSPDLAGSDAQLAGLSCHPA